MLIDQNGDMQGLATLEDALKTASSVMLDLVQVSPINASPVVCGKNCKTVKENRS